MKKIAVILCSKSKQDYACSVREMYCSSVLFRAREYFMDLCYDEWYVNTSKYGFMSPDKVIEPYDSWYITKTSSNSQLKNNPNLTIDELNTMTGWLTSNLKLREFLKVHLIPRLLDKNPDVIEKFIHSKETVTQCEEAKNF